MKVVIFCIIFFFQSSLEAPVDPVKIEHEILEKIGKHGTIINIFEARHDEIQRIKRDLTANANYDFKTGSLPVSVGVGVPVGSGSVGASYQRDLNLGDRSVGGSVAFPLTSDSKNPVTFQGTYNKDLNSGNENVGAGLTVPIFRHSGNPGTMSLNYNRHLQSGNGNVGLQLERPFRNGGSLTGNFNQDLNSGQWNVGAGYKIKW
uniref:Attacin C-terminal domain-containing protein n=1 Tax=Panagrolaimus sp. PS1159 TaxID=55785 RepID=A0AC35EY35_9BILA